MLAQLYLDLMGDKEITTSDTGWMETHKTDYEDSEISYYSRSDLSVEQIPEAIGAILNIHVEDATTIAQFLTGDLNAQDLMYRGVRANLDISPNGDFPAVVQFNVIQAQGENLVELMFFAGKEAVRDAIKLSAVGPIIPKH